MKSKISAQYYNALSELYPEKRNIKNSSNTKNIGAKTNKYLLFWKLYWLFRLTEVSLQLYEKGFFFIYNAIFPKKN